MIVLDENIDVFQRQQLDRWGMHFRRIGGEIGRFGMKDCNEVIPLLHALRRPTFFTRDRDFYQPWLRHSGYCLVFLEVAPSQTVNYLRRFLRHPAFRTQAQRMGKVINAHQEGVAYWQVGVDEAQKIEW
jgi:hypothetical protein